MRKVDISEQGVPFGGSGKYRVQKLGTKSQRNKILYLEIVKHSLEILGKAQLGIPCCNSVKLWLMSQKGFRTRVQVMDRKTEANFRKLLTLWGGMVEKNPNKMQTKGTFTCAYKRRCSHSGLGHSAQRSLEFLILPSHYM